MSTPDPGVPIVTKRPRILLVEDNDAASRGLAKILAALGYDVAVVRDGASALAALRDVPPPDFLLTDLRLPDLDGREVALTARQLVPPPRIALITGWDLEPDLKDSASWGIDWVFAKPLNVQELVSKLRGAAPVESPESGAKTPGSPTESHEEGPGTS